MTLTLLILSTLTGTGSVGESPQELDMSAWVSMALQNSPAIYSSEAALLSARACLASDRAFLYPSLSASAGVSRSWSESPLPGEGAVESETNSYSAGLTLSQEILQSGGQNWLYEDASEISLQAAEADHRKTILDVTLEVTNSYYDVLEAIELKRSAINAHERSKSQLQRTEALYGMGAVTTLEMLQIQVQESSDRLAVSRREQALQSSYADLYNAAGADPAGPELVINTNAVIEPLPAASVRDIPMEISDNPALIAAQLRQRASEIRTEAAGRAYWPSLRATAGWNWNDNTLDDLDRMFDSDGYNVGLSLSWTIFDGLLRESRINSARASELGSLASLQSLEDDLGSAVRTLSNSLEIDIQYYHDSMLALELAQEQYRLSQMSYEMGALSLLDLLQAQSDLTSSETNLVSARTAALKTEASLMVSIGRSPRLGE